MKPLQIATLFGTLGLAAVAATTLLTQPAESYAPRLSAEPPMPLRTDPIRPTLDTLEVMAMVENIGDDQSYDEPYCDLRVTVTEKLTNEFAETRIGQPDVVDGIYVELWASEANRTWSALATRPDGISCVVQTGRDWAGETSLEALEPKADA